MGAFDDFLSGVLSDCVNARYRGECARCLGPTDSPDVTECRACYERRETQSARNDGPNESGI